MCNVVLVQSNDDTKNVHVFGIWIKTLTTNGCNFFQEKEPTLIFVYYTKNIQMKMMKEL